MRVATLVEPAPAADESPAPLGWWGWTWRSAATLFVLVAAYVSVRLIYEQALAPFYAPVPAVAIGHDTTRLDGPLDAQGHVDFVAVLNQEAAAGVTPENNAVIQLMAACGPLVIREDARAEYFRRLGVEPPPAAGEYLNWDDERLYSASQHEINVARVYSHCERHPWTRDASPEIAKRLDANREPLAKLIAASERPAWYSPCLSPAEDPGLAYDAFRAAVRILSCRAMLRIGEGDFDGAASDAAAIDRLSDLIGRGPSLNEWGRSHVSFGMSTRIRRALAVDPRVPAASLACFRQEEHRRPRAPDFARVVDRSDRFAFVTVCLGRNRAAGGELSALVDWNAALQEGHPWFDRAVAAFRLKDPRERRQALTVWDTDFHRRGAQDASDLVEWLRGESLRTLRGKAVGRFATYTITFRYPGIANLLDLRQAEQDLNDLAFALAEYRSAAGVYPETLEALVPEYIAQLLPDAGAQDGNAYSYERTYEGYLLSSRYPYHDSIFSDGGEHIGLRVQVPPEPR